MERLDALAVEQPREQADAHAPDLGKRLVHRGQPRCDDLRLSRVVEANDPAIFEPAKTPTRVVVWKLLVVGSA